jgi:hypothetical protein
MTSFTLFERQAIHGLGLLGSSFGRFFFFRATRLPKTTPSISRELRMRSRNNSIYGRAAHAQYLTHVKTALTGRLKTHYVSAPTILCVNMDKAAENLKLMDEGVCVSSTWPNSDPFRLHELVM